MPRKKKHYYLSQFYLRGFVDPNREPFLWVYEKGNPEIRQSKPENTAFENYYHAFETKDGRDTDTVENWLEKTESEIAPLILKLCRHEALDDRERWVFSYFLALMIVRVPNFRSNVEGMFGELQRKIVDGISRMEGFEEIVRNHEKRTGKSLANPADLKQFVLGEYNGDVGPDLSLGLMIGNRSKITRIFHDMTWTFIEATDEWKFVTSDNPLFFHDPTHDPGLMVGGGLGSKNVEVSFPITQDLALVATWDRLEGLEGGYLRNKELVKNTCRRTVINAQRFIYASEKSDALSRLVQKHLDSSPKWEALKAGEDSPRELTEYLISVSTRSSANQKEVRK